mgnify:CR=1 FL=1
MKTLKTEIGRSKRLTSLGLLGLLSLSFAAHAEEDARRAAGTVFPAGQPATQAAPRSIPRESPDWWLADIWVDPERPFLYYGEPPEDRRPKVSDPPVPVPAKQPLEATPRDNTDEKPALPRPLESLQSMAEVREEMARRLDIAVMHPNEENIASYLEANAFVLGKAHVFADRFQRVRIAKPEYDWTAAHPVANHATAELGSAAASDADRFLERIAAESGLIFVGADDGAMNALSAGPAASFAKRYGFETLAVTPTGETLPGFAATKHGNGFIAKLGLTRRPALLLVAKPDARHPALAPLAAAGKPLLFGTGPLAVSELKKRLMLLLSPEMTGATDETLPTRNGRALESGEAFLKRRSSPISSAAPLGTAAQSAPAQTNAYESALQRLEPSHLEIAPLDERTRAPH